MACQDKYQRTKTFINTLSIPQISDSVTEQQNGYLNLLLIYYIEISLFIHAYCESPFHSACFVLFDYYYYHFLSCKNKHESISAYGTHYRSRCLAVAR